MLSTSLWNSSESLEGSAFDFLTDSTSAVDVISFVREVMEKFPDLRAGIIERLLENFSEMKTGRVFRGALWIIGEYAVDGPAIIESMKQISLTLGEIPILASEEVYSAVSCFFSVYWSLAMRTKRMP